MGPCRLLKTIFAQFLGKYRVVSALFGKIERLTFTGTFDAFQHLVKSHSFKQICFPHRSEMGVLKSFLRLMGEAGYFDGAAITKPLLHLWSLAIEEQFYILFPILVWGGWRLSHSVRYLGWLVGGITLSSLVGCMLVKDPTVNFYFPLTRFWELGLGICVAYEEKCRGFNFGNISSRLRDGMSTVGFAMILLSIGFYDEAFRAPGPMSLLPVIGACLLIIAHEDAFITQNLGFWSCRRRRKTADLLVAQANPGYSRG